MQFLHSIFMFTLIPAIWLTVGAYFLIKKNRYRLLSGMVVNTTIIAYFVALTAFIIDINNSTVGLIYGGILFLLLLPIIFFMISAAYLFIWNGIIVWRRESHSLGNVLTLAIGILLIVIPAFFTITKDWWPNSKILTYMQNTYSLLMLYVVFWVLTFLTSYVLTKVVHPKYDKDYAIVLGSGLIDGKIVSPLLGSRIQAAIDFQKKQMEKSGKALKIIMSGGQGGDEKLPEGVAMKQYALDKGVSEDDILVDDQSKNTYQNMLYSKQVIEEAGLNPQAGIFTTNDYHVFRAAGFARAVGLNIDGVGSKTSKYFLPNALIREYIAILLRHKRFHAVVVALILLLNVGVFFS
ncbi:YdcF family protein [Fructobacillus sp. M2-14]|uniref:YdcF family protein n=1 Tax=Fructobacillus broussonetiae TaxID=2713173 RepID=A0ABS5QY68_9LACO|nr:YdcF family protein [Fructobacillus broussonetiae]MBS9338149.1 YdcF family protein [Fructobacillus broussonetiae]